MNKKEIIESLIQKQVIEQWDEDTLTAVVEFAQAKTEREVTRLAEHLNSFDFIEGIMSYADYGKHQFCRDFGLTQEDLDDMCLTKHIDFNGYGENLMAGETCGFTSLGFVECLCDLEKIMKGED